MKAEKIPAGLHLSLSAAALTMWAVWTSFFDPVVFPKFIVLMVAGSLVLGYLFSQFVWEKVFRAYFLIVLLFLIILLSLSLGLGLTHTSFFGVQGRNMGFLSYFALSIISIYFANLRYSARTTSIVVNWSLTTFGSIALYGCLEILGVNLFKLDSIYEGITGPLGNPNFMSTACGLSAGMCFSSLLMNRKKTPANIVLITVAFASLVTIYFSRSTQGWIVFLIGILPALYLTIRKWGRKAEIGFIGGISSLFALFTLAIFNLGPFKNLVYEQSLAFRADFWRIAWRMAVENPFTGVGIDRYQNYYREYKTLDQVRRVGAEDFSDSAHNLYLHFAATGGFFLAIVLLILNIFVAFRFVKVIKSEMPFAGVTCILFGAWLAIQAQSLISIDFPAIAIWGWIFAGIGVGASISQKSNQAMKLSLGRKYLGVFSSIVFSITSIIIITPLASAQSDLQKGFYAQVDKADSESVSTKSNFLIQMEKKDPGNPTLPILSANSLFQDGAFREAANAARRAINIDNHDYRSWWFLASSLEQLGMRKEAIPARLKTIELSPFSSQNLLELARDYASQNDIEGVKNVVGQLGQIDIKSAEYLEASRLVKP